MKNDLKDFLSLYINLFFEALGYKKSGDKNYKKISADVCQLVTVEPGRFNYAGHYEFNIIINLIGLSSNAAVTGNLTSIIKNGNTLIAAINIKDILKLPPVPYALENNNAEALFNQIKNDFEQENINSFLNIKTIADVEAILIGPQYSRFIFNLAVYFATVGNKEKSNYYFNMIKAQGAIVKQAAASFGIILSD